MKRIRYGIIGTGNTVGIAKNHIKGLKPCEDMVLTAIYDIDPAKSKAMYEECGLEQVSICQSRDELFSLVDAVGICLPNCLHVEAGIAALAAGKHILIEKPVSTDEKSLEPLLQAVKAKPDLVAMVCFNYREFPIYRCLKEMIESGVLGEIYHCRLQLGGNRIADKHVGLEWRMNREYSGGGAISDFGCHLLDITQYLFEPVCGPIVELNAFTTTRIKERKDLKDGSLKPVTNDDCGVFIGKMANGTVLSYSTSRIGIWNHSIEITAEGGMVYGDFNNDDVITLWLKDKNGGYEQEDKQVLKVSGPNGHEGILQNFADCINRKTVNTRTVFYAGKIQSMIDHMAKNKVWKRTDEL